MYVIIEPFQGTNIPLNTISEDDKVTCGAEVVPPEVESYTTPTSKYSIQLLLNYFEVQMPPLTLCIRYNKVTCSAEMVPPEVEPYTIPASK